MRQDTLAAIDIGSNAVRLLINTVEVFDGKPEFRKSAYLRVPLRLGEDVFTQKRVTPAKISQLLDAMQGFTHIMRAYGVAAFRVCATSAMRDAENGQEVVDSVKEKTGVEIEVISGNDEADILYTAGALAEPAKKDTPYIYVDVGGGSTEIVVFSGRRKVARHSFQIGTVRMLNNAITEEEQIRFCETLTYMYNTHAPQNMIASGGNINKIRKILEKKNGSPILYFELAALHEELRPLSFEERMRLYGLNNYRADVIVPALEIFLNIGACCPSIKKIYVPKLGVADGMIRMLYAQREQNIF